MMGSLLLLSLLLVVFEVRFSGDVSLAGNGGYKDWRLGTATYIKESQGHPHNDGMYVCTRPFLSILFHQRHQEYQAGREGNV